MLTFLVPTAELSCNCSFFFLRKGTYSSHYYYIQMSFSENVLSYSVESVHTALFTTMYRWFFLKMFLVIFRRLYILITLLLRTAEVFWKCSYLFWGVCTYFLHYYYVQQNYTENFLRFSEDVLHAAHITTKYIWGILKMIIFILWELYLLFTLQQCKLSFSENILSYSKDIAQYAHITTMYRCFFLKIFLDISRRIVHYSHIYTIYRWVFLKMFLVIPSWQYFLLTFELCTNEFFWKCY